MSGIPCPRCGESDGYHTGSCVNRDTWPPRCPHHAPGAIGAHTAECASHTADCPPSGHSHPGEPVDAPEAPQRAVVDRSERDAWRDLAHALIERDNADSMLGSPDAYDAALERIAVAADRVLLTTRSDDQFAAAAAYRARADRSYRRVLASMTGASAPLPHQVAARAAWQAGVWPV